MSDDSVLLAYLAGIMDGEGCFCINRGRPKKSNPVGTWVAAVVSTMTDEGPIRLLHQTFGGYCFSAKPSKAGNRMRFIWGISGPGASTACKKLMPYLRIKQLQAQLCIDLNEIKSNRASHNIAGPLTQAEINERMEIWTKCSNLNHRGKQRKFATDWPIAVPKKRRELKNVCPNGHIGKYGYVNSKEKPQGVVRRCLACSAVHQARLKQRRREARAQ